MNIQPIDGAYFPSAYFIITTGIALVVAFAGAVIESKEGN